MSLICPGKVELVWSGIVVGWWRTHAAAAGERFTGRVPLPTVLKHSPRSTAAPSLRWPGSAARHCGSGCSAQQPRRHLLQERSGLPQGLAAQPLPATPFLGSLQPAQHRRAPVQTPAAMGPPSGVAPSQKRRTPGRNGLGTRLIPPCTTAPGQFHKGSVCLSWLS